MRKKRLILQLAKSILLLLFIFFIGLCGYCLSKHNSFCGIIITCFAVIIAGWLLLSVLQPLTSSKHSWFVIMLFLMLSFWGIIIYQPNEISGIENVFIEKIITPLNKTLSIFFPSRGSFDDEPVVAGDVNVSFHLLHLFAYFFFALFMFSIFGRRLFNSSRRFIILSHNRSIFWGESEAGILLAQDIINTELWRQPIFVFSHSEKDDTQKDKALFEKIDSMGGIVIYRDFNAIRRYPKGYSHFFLTDDQDLNLKMALKVSQTAKKSKQKIKIYLRSEMHRVDYLFRDMTNIDLQIINQSSLAARQFVLKNPLIELVPDDKINNLTVDFDFNILILGFGWQGRELLHKTICGGQFKGSRFSATIIDKDIDMKNGEYKILFDECIKEYKISFIENEGINNIGSKDFYHWFNGNHRRYVRIFVAMGDDAQNFNVSCSMANIMIAAGDMNPQKRLFVNIANADKYLYCDYPVTMFGRLDKLYTCEVIIAHKLDRVAKAVNYVYWNYRNEDFDDIDWVEAEKIWTNMSNKNSTFSKNSSRALALNVENIIKISGGRTAFDKAIKNPEMLEILAENEHLRWNAFHFTEGITRWNNIDDNAVNDAKMFKFPHEKTWLLKHACLVTYNDLDKISDRVNEIRKKTGTLENKGVEDYKEVDRMIVRHFGMFFDILNFF